MEGGASLSMQPMDYTVNLQNKIIKINVTSNLMTCNSGLFWREINKTTKNYNNDCVVPINRKIGI